MLRRTTLLPNADYYPCMQSEYGGQSMKIDFNVSAQVSVTSSLRQIRRAQQQQQQLWSNIATDAARVHTQSRNRLRAAAL